MALLPTDQVAKILAGTLTQPPRAPSGLSPWEQMGFNAGGMLGKAVGAIPLANQINQEQQVQQAQVNKIINAPGSTIDKYTKLGDFYTSQGDMSSAHNAYDAAHKAVQSSIDLSKLQNTKAQEAIANKQKKRNLDIMKQRADAYDKWVNKTIANKQVSTAMQKNMSELKDFYNKSQDTSLPKQTRQMYGFLFNHGIGRSNNTNITKQDLANATTFMGNADTRGIPADFKPNLAMTLASDVAQARLNPSDTRTDSQIYADTIKNLATDAQAKGHSEIYNWLSDLGGKLYDMTHPGVPTSTGSQPQPQVQAPAEPAIQPATPAENIQVYPAEILNKVRQKNPKFAHLSDEELSKLIKQQQGK